MKRISKLLQKILVEAAPPAPARKPTQPAAAPVVMNPTLKTRLDMVNRVLNNMRGFGRPLKVSLLFAGGTGIGKTSFIQEMGLLLGMPMIIVEAPHITEEHMVNIPFVIFDKGRKVGSDKTSVKTFELELAESYLASKLEALHQDSDSELLKTINNSNASTQALWRGLGGDEKTIPAKIKDQRQRFQRILFVDEYQRRTTGNVRSMLRALLDGMIGNSKMPSGTYPVYASNLVDVGQQTIEPMHANQQHSMVDYPAPSKDDLFHHISSKFEHKGRPLKPEVINAFLQALDEEHVAYDDVESAIRTSPRRWEQLLLYVDAATPVKSAEEAKALLANIKANFVNTELHTSDTTTVSGLYNKVDKIVRDIIKITSGEDFAGTRANSPVEWRDTVMHQVQMAEKLGTSRKYVPIVSGLHGIGKTSNMAMIADALNLRLVTVNCQNVTQEMMSGITLPEQLPDKPGYKTKFSKPPLYLFIETEMQKAADAFLNDKNVPAEKKEAWKKKPFKYLMFFDEINRVKDQNVFNSFRKLILEKQFDVLPLPNKESTIVVAAMNPGGDNTKELSSHMRDAVDQIEAAPSWRDQDAWHKYLLQSEDLDDVENAEARDLALKLTDDFGSFFALQTVPRGSNMDPNSLRFYIKMSADSEGDAGNHFYLAPREYTQMFAELARALDDVVNEQDKFEDAQGRFDVDKYVDALANVAHKTIMQTLKTVLHKQGEDSDLFSQEVENWLEDEKASMLKKEAPTASLESILDDLFEYAPNKHLKDDVNFANLVTQSFDKTKFSEDFSNYLQKMLREEKNALDLLSKQTHNKKKFAQGQVQIAKDMHDKLNYLADELISAVDEFNLSGDVIESFRVPISNLIGDIQDMADDDADMNFLLSYNNDIFKKLAGIK